MKKRIIALLLCFAMMFTMTAYAAPAPGEPGVTVYFNGNPQSAVVLPHDNEIRLNAVPNSDRSGSYQWQLNIAGDLWVDVTDANASELRVSYGMVANLLQGGATRIRVKMTSGDTEVCSEPVTITVSYADSYAGAFIPEDGTVQSNGAVAVLDDDGNYFDEAYALPPVVTTPEVTVAPTVTPEVTVAPTVTPEVTAAPTVTPEVTAAPTVTPEVTAAPTVTPEATVAPTATPAPTVAPTPTPAPARDEDDGNIIQARSGSTSNMNADGDNVPVSLADEEAPGKVSITINYFFSGGNKNGQAAANPWTATVPADQPFEQTIVSPVIRGYKASQEQVALDYNATEMTAGRVIVISVQYVPDTAPYTVIHYHQNIDNDNYVEAKRFTVTAQKTDDYVDAQYVEGTYAGFYPLAYEKPQIASDGSTVIEVYYDRYYYLMSFSLDGGFGVDPKYARYGATINEVPDPEKPGWTFMGWKADGDTTDNLLQSEDLPTTMPARNTHYTAVWGDPQTVNYTVVYWRENADDTNYSIWGSEVKQAVAGSTVSGGDTVPASITETIVDGDELDERPYFTYNDALTDKNVVVNGDGSSVVHVYYTRNYYTIFFYGISGTCVLEEHTHGDGNCVRPLICHIHDNTCIKSLTCTTPEHTHSDACCPNAHTHSDACCEKDVHTAHTRDCYSFSGNAYISNNAESEYTANQLNNRTPDANGVVSYDGNYYVKLGNSWYRLRSYYHGYTTITLTCGGLHTHGDGNCECDTPEHDHTEGNCVCDLGLTNHKHNDACYRYSCEDTMHDHTDACYGDCIKYEHEHDTNCTRERDDNYIYVVHAKYNADVSAVWPTAANFPNITLRGWSIDGISATAVSKRVNMTSDLCDTRDGVKYAEAVTSGSKRYLYYMFESFDQRSPANGNERILRNGVYYDKSEEYYQEVNSSGSWNQKEIMGMAPVSGGVVTSGSNIFLYYTRNRHDVIFHNYGGATVRTETEVMYGQPLAAYPASGTLLSATTAPYPTGSLEDGIYVFDGWYTTPEGFEGTKFDFDTGTMPDNDLHLYAKWVPITHNVKFHLSRTSMEAGITVAEELMQGDDPDYHSHPDRTVPHNTILGKVNSPGATESDVNHPYKGYTFDGWFYVDEKGDEHAFLPESMPVTQDLMLYAKWSSNVLRPYNVHFVLDEDGDGKADIVNGSYVYIADSITGSALAGNTRTFDAKGGTDLYAGYQEGYFPIEASHSITVNIADETGLGANTYYFIYQPKPAVPYTVKYLEAGTNQVLHEEKYVSNNRQAVVTENFVVIQGYMPDAYQKKLGVSAEEGAENVIIFWYTKDTEHAYYKVAHYVQQPDGSFVEYTGSEVVGDIGATYSAAEMSISGYSFSYDLTNKYNVTDKVNGAENTTLPAAVTVAKNGDTNKYEVSGELVAAGLELNLYYVPNYYPYEIRYLEATTGVELHAPKTGAAAYGDIINEQAIRFGVDMNSDGLITDDELIYKVDQNTKLTDIKVEETVYTKAQTEADDFTVPAETAKVNIITFWYTRESGNLLVSKTVEDKSVDQSAPKAPFEFTLVLNYQVFNSTSFEFTKYVVNENGEEVPTAGGYLPVEADKVTIKFELTDGETILIKGLPTAAYSIYETVPEDFKSSSPNGVSFDLKNTHTEENPKVVDFTNEYPVKTGHLLLRKEVEFLYANDALTFNDTFTFTVDLLDVAANKTFAVQVEGETRARSITADASGVLVLTEIPADKNVTILDAPAGAYTVTESASAQGLADNYSLTRYVSYNSDGEPTTAGSIQYATNPVGVLSGSGTITAGYTVSTEFTNKYTRHHGDLQINKTVSFDYPGEKFAGDTFNFTLATTVKNTVYNVEITDAKGNTVSTTAKSEEDGKLTVPLTVPADGKGDYSILIRDLPLGNYTVTETMATPDDYTTTPGTSVSVEVKGDGTIAQADFTNAVKRSKGNLLISKEIWIDPSAENESLTDAMKELDFEFIVDFSGDEVLGGTYAITVTDVNGNPVAGAPTELTVRDSVTVTNSQGVQETYNNVLYLTLKHNQQALIEGLYIGQYTVREIAKAGYDSSYEEMEGTRDTLEPVEIKKGETATASCINGFPFYYGDLNVIKEVEKRGELDTLPEGHEFHFNVKLSNFDIDIAQKAVFDYVKYDTKNTADLSDDVLIEKGLIYLENHEFNFTLKDNERMYIQQINVCDYVITETAAEGVLDHYDTEIDIDKVEGNIDPDGGVETADVNNETRTATGTLAANDVDTVMYKNVYKKHLNELTIRKTGAARIDENQSFIFTVTGYTNGLTCEPATDGDEISLRVVITIPAGETSGSVTLSNLPLGTYTITEEGTWSWRYDSKTVKYTLTDAENQVVTINNTRDVIRWLNGAAASKNTFTKRRDQ